LEFGSAHGNSKGGEAGQGRFGETDASKPRAIKTRKMSLKKRKKEESLGRERDTENIIDKNIDLENVDSDGKIASKGELIFTI